MKIKLFRKRNLGDALGDARQRLARGRRAVAARAKVMRNAGKNAGLAAGSAAALLAGWTAVSYLAVRGAEKPRYRVLEKKQDYELREYEPFIMAETDVRGTYNGALARGFRELYGYISGNNAGHQKLSMAAPVTERRSGEGVRTISFVMPSRYNMETLPAPSNPGIRLRQLPGRKVAALRFSGYATPRRVEHKKKELLNDLNNDKIRPASVPEFAGYNPPFTIPFLMRNEIMVEVA